MNKDLPDDWKYLPLSDFVIEYRGGAALRPSDFNYRGFPVIPKKAVQLGGKIVLGNELTYCHNEFAEENSSHIVDSRYIISTLRDLVPSGPSIGLVGVLEEPGEFLLAQGVYGFLLNQDLDKSFFAHISNTDWYRKLMQKIMVGSTQVHIRTTEFLQINLSIPPLIEQKKIAEILSTIEQERITLKTHKQKLINLKSGLFDLLFNPEIIKKNNLSKNSIVSFKNARFKDLVILKRGVDLPIQNRNKGNIPVIGSNGITSYHNQSTQDHPGIVTGRSGSIGKVYLSEEPFWALNTTLYSEKLFDNDIRYIYYFLQWFNLERFSTGTGVPTLNRNNLHVQKILIPPISYQKSCAWILSNLDNHIFKLKEKISKLDILKKAIASDLLSGRKRVNI